MSQIATENVPTFEIIPSQSDKQPKQRKPRVYRGKSDPSAVDKKDATLTEQPKKKEAAPLRANQLLIGRQHAGIVNKIKALYADHETVDLTGAYGMGNSKVIIVANNMVQWGYASISKITTKAPATLEIMLKKSADFTKVCDDFEAVRAKRAELRKKKAEEQADKAQLESENATKSTEEETEKVVLSAVEAGLE